MVVVPPKEVRVVLERTAQYVIRHGQAFEEKILLKEANNPKFSFLQPSDPYHAFYQQVLRGEEGDGAKSAREASEKVAKEGGETGGQKEDGAVGVGGGSIGGAVLNETAATGDEQLDRPGKGIDEEIESKLVEPDISKARVSLVRQQAARPVPTKPPDPEIFTPLLPPPPEDQSVSLLDVEVMKLTAQFASRFGRPFLAAINAREYRNPLFGFLNPSHPRFVSYQRLLEAYRLIIEPTEELKVRLKASSDCTKVIDRILYRLDWEQLQEEKLNEESDGDRVVMQTIDWHDFRVVETVDINESDETVLPAPVKNKDVAAELRLREEAARVAQQQQETDMDIDIDDDEDEEPPVAVPQILPSAEIPESMVRRNYVPAPKAANQAKNVGGQSVTVILPTGQTVPVQDAAESLKVHLRDPRYKEERMKAQEKNSLLNLATNAEIARNLGQLTERQTEVFDRKDLQDAVAAQKSALPVSFPPARPLASVTRPALPSGTPTMEESDTKRARLETPEVLPLPPEGSHLLPEEEFIKRVGMESVQVQVKMPIHSGKDWNLDGQVLDLEVPLTANVGELKATIASVTQLPANKQKVQVEWLGFLKDSLSLAHYNIRPKTSFLVEVKERGGRKK